MSETRHFAYTSPQDEAFFAGLGVPIVSQDQFKIALTASTMDEIGKTLSDPDEQLYMPSLGTTTSMAELLTMLMELRRAETKVLFFIVFKPLTNFSDHKIRVSCCIVRDLGGASLQSQLVPNDQPPEEAITKKQITRSYEAFRVKCPADGRTTSKFDEYALSVQLQVDFLGRAYKSSGFAHIRDPLKDHFQAYDKSTDYTNDLLDIIEETEGDGSSIGGFVREKLYQHTSFIRDIPFIGEAVGLIIDESTDLLAGGVSMVEDAIGEAARAVDPFLRPLLNNVPVLGQAADYVAYGVMQSANAFDVTTGDMMDEIKLRL